MDQLVRDLLELFQEIKIDVNEKGQRVIYLDLVESYRLTMLLKMLREKIDEV